MKTLLLCICLLPLTVMAQKLELSALGGMRSDGSWTGNAGAHLKLGNLQPAVVFEVIGVNAKYKFSGYTTGNYVAYAPGVNLAYLFEMRRGYVYPALIFRYRTPVTDGAYKYSGMEFGVQMGVTVKLVKSLYLNGEVGFRSENVQVDVTGTPSGVGTGLGNASLSNIIIPVLAGLRYRF